VFSDEEFFMERGGSLRGSSSARISSRGRERERERERESLMALFPYGNALRN
jgi:hypothetical protein